MENSNVNNHENLLIFRFLESIDEFDNNTNEDFIEFVNSKFPTIKINEELNLGDSVDTLLKQVKWKRILEALEKNIFIINEWYLDLNREDLIKSFINFKEETINFEYNDQIILKSSIVGDQDNYSEYSNKAESLIRKSLSKEEDKKIIQTLNKIKDNFGINDNIVSEKENIYELPLFNIELEENVFEINIIIFNKLQTISDNPIIHNIKIEIYSNNKTVPIVWIKSLDVKKDSNRIIKIINGIILDKNINFILKNFDNTDRHNWNESLFRNIDLTDLRSTLIINKKFSN